MTVPYWQYDGSPACCREAYDSEGHRHRQCETVHELLAALAERAEKAEAEVKRLVHGYGLELMDTARELALAFGMEEDPEYGFPTGDHTTVTLAAEVRRVLDALREQHGEAVALLGGTAKVVRAAETWRDRRAALRASDEAGANVPLGHLADAEIFTADALIAAVDELRRSCAQ